MNACSWKPSTVTLADGRQVLSDSEEWRAECEAMHFLSKGIAQRTEILAALRQKRGDASAEAVQAAMNACEPAYVLSLPNKAQRNGYLDDVARQYGQHAADWLKSRATDLHKARAKSTGAAPAQ